MLPAAASLQKQGANRGAVASFLVSTPESGVDSIAVTYALLDPLMTLVRPVAAFITGISAGIVENLVSYRKQTFTSFSNEKSSQPSFVGSSRAEPKHQHVKTGFIRKMYDGVRYGCLDIWGDIVFWFFAGLLIAGMITVFIPEDFSSLVLGGGMLSMLTMLLIGMPIYICATASTPIAAALLLKGVSPGAVLVFLLAGPVTNMTSLSVLLKILGTAGTFRYFFIIAICSLLFGLTVDWIYQFLDLEPKTLVQQVRETIPFELKLVSGLILISISMYHLGRWLRIKLQRGRTIVYKSGFPDLQPIQHKHITKHQHKK